ncbi:MAG: hypothetical protein WA019_00700 [Candidatus Moraniibacteriota bacterium]
MAQIQGSQVKLNNGQVITPQTGAWYDGQQFWNGSLSQPNQIHPDNPNKGGTTVSPEVVAQSNIAQGLKPGTNEAFLAKQTADMAAAGGTAPTGATAPVTAPAVPTDLEKQASELQKSIETKKTEADKRRSLVNENPFLSEGSRVGAIAKIDSLLNDSLATDQASLTYLNTQIANAKAELKPDYQITTETDNAGNMTVVTIDKKTGKLVSSVNAGKIGKADKPNTKSDTETSKENKTLLVQGLYSQANSYGHVPPEVWNAAKQAWIDDGLGTPDDFEKQFGGLTDPMRKDYGQASGYQMNKDYRDKLFGI